MMWLLAIFLLVSIVIVVVVVVGRVNRSLRSWTTRSRKEGLHGDARTTSFLIETFGFCRSTPTFLLVLLTIDQKRC